MSPADDHAFPGVEEDAYSVARHIWACAVNTAWARSVLGDRCRPDWDMYARGGTSVSLQYSMSLCMGGLSLKSTPFSRVF